MGVTDVPQWLCSAFVRSVLAVGGTASREEIAEVCGRLLDRWQEPDRHFHNVKHLVDLLARVDELAQETHHPDAVRLAAWYHGAIFHTNLSKVYARSGGEDEVASATLATEELSALGVPPATVARIAEMITNLRRHDADVRDIDCLALSDADLAVLAVEPQRYRSYRQAVRTEYAQIPDRHYLEARTAIVGRLLARRNIFLSPMGSRWEDRARENLRAELERLETELSALGAAAPGESVAAAEAAARAAAATPSEAGAGADEPAEAAAAPDALPGRAPVLDEAAAPAQDPVRPPGRPAGPADRGLANPPEPFAYPAAVPAGPGTAGRDGRPSSLEAAPADFEGLGHASGPDDRERAARTAREAIDAAVRERRTRAVEERAQRDRFEAARAERDQAAAAARERRRAEAHGSARSAATPADAGAPEQPTAELSSVEGSSAATPADRTAATEPAPQHGIEREPEYFDIPRRRRKGR